MLLQGILAETVRRVGACVIGVGVLWQVAERAGRGDGEAVIHVTESGVVVRIDGYECPYESWPASPTTRSLRAGNHTLTVTREGRVIHDETFTVDPGTQVVLTARDDTRPASPPESRLASER